MAITAEKKQYPETKRVKHDPENGQISRDQFIAKRNKQKEYDKRLAVEGAKIKEELEQEEKCSDKVQTVETVKKDRKPKKTTEPKV